MLVTVARRSGRSYDTGMSTQQEVPPSDPAESSPGSDARARVQLPRLRRWEMVVAGCAAFLVIAGVAVKGYHAVRGDDGADKSRRVAENRSGGTMTGHGLVDEGGSTQTFPWPVPQGQEPGEESSRSTVEVEDWSPVMLRSGFGFFVGFALGFVLKTFFRISSFIGGAALLLLFGLSYAGWIEVRWEVMQEHWDAWAGRLGDELGEFKAFVAGSVPTLGLGGFGFFTGVRKR